MTHEEHNRDHHHVDTYGCSCKGKKREVNGDQFVVAELRRAARVRHASAPDLGSDPQFGANQAHVLLVADGVSGQAGADSASRIVVDDVMDSILNAVPWTPTRDVASEARLRRQLQETVVRCNDHVAAEARHAPGKRNMASTLTLAFVRWPTLFVVHAGDSRAYLLRQGHLEQLTTDHTLAQKMVEQGQLTRGEADTSHFAHMLWNAVGGSREVQPELTVSTLHSGDTVLLCTDGLTAYLSDGAIAGMVDRHETAREACEALVATVRQLGGHDDVTVALARFDDVDHQLAAIHGEPAHGKAMVIPSVPPRMAPPRPNVRVASQG